MKLFILLMLFPSFIFANVQLELKSGIIYEKDKTISYTGKDIKFKNGKIKFKKNYKNGVLNGKYVLYYLNGNKKLETNYKDGYIEGKYLEYFEDGKKRLEEEYKNRKLNGKKISYFRTNKIEFEKNYKNGVLDDKYIIYYLNGNKKLEANYKNGKLHGEYFEYYKDGKRKLKKEYQDGIDININTILVRGINIKNYKGDKLVLKKSNIEKYKIKASSSLNEYKIKNIDDKKLTTAWIEGKKDYGVGEYFELAQTDRIPRYILNGYHKSKKIWKENSRVKTFKVLIDNKKYFLLHLKDSMQQQKFELPINKNIKHSYKFIIVDIYKGDKYKDTAISDISHSVSISTMPPTIKKVLNNKKYHGHIIYRYFGNKKMSKNIFKNEKLIKTIQYYKNGNKKAILNYSKCRLGSDVCSQIYCDLNGDFVQYYKNGKIQFKAHFKNDKLNGKFVYFTLKGKKLIETKFKDGLISKSFYYNKSKKIETKFENKKPINGFFIKVNKLYGALERNDFFIGLELDLSYYKNKKLKSHTIYYPNGNKRLEENYKDGVLNGKQVGFYKNGKLSYENNYANGILVKKNITYYQNGNKRSEKDYINKKYYQWYENGDIYVEANLKNNVLEMPIITAQKLGAQKYLEKIKLESAEENMCNDGDFSFSELKSCSIQQVSSTLENKDNSYSAENLTDNNPKTAWIEGVTGYGIGESFITKKYIINEIYNGYQKSKKIWKNNSRVKELKIYIDGKFKFYLKLHDIMEPQLIVIPNIISEELSLRDESIIKYEIIKVYQGDKYQDTAISEVKTLVTPFDSCN